MKKTYQRLPESELDIMLVLWNNTPPMTRPEIEKVINMKKNLARYFLYTYPYSYTKISVIELRGEMLHGKEQYVSISIQRNSFADKGGPVYLRFFPALRRRAVPDI